MEPWFFSLKKLALLCEVKFVIERPRWGQNDRHVLIDHVVKLHVLHLELEFCGFLELTSTLFIPTLNPFLEAYFEFVKAEK